MQVRAYGMVFQAQSSRDHHRISCRTSNWQLMGATNMRISYELPIHNEPSLKHPTHCYFSTPINLTSFPNSYKSSASLITRSTQRISATMHFPVNKLVIDCFVDCFLASLVVTLVGVRCIHQRIIRPLTPSHMFGNVCIGLSTLMIVGWALGTTIKRIGYIDYVKHPESSNHDTAAATLNRKKV